MVGEVSQRLRAPGLAGWLRWPLGQQAFEVLRVLVAPGELGWGVAGKVVGLDAARPYCQKSEDASDSLVAVQGLVCRDADVVAFEDQLVVVVEAIADRCVASGDRRSTWDAGTSCGSSRNGPQTHSRISVSSSMAAGWLVGWITSVGGVVVGRGAPRAVIVGGARGDVEAA